MRFEGKNKQLKNAARATSFRNILKTITEHHQRLIAFSLQYDKKFASVAFIAGPSMHVKPILFDLAEIVYIAAKPLTSLISLPYFNEIQTHHSSLLNENLCM